MYLKSFLHTSDTRLLLENPEFVTFALIKTLGLSETRFRGPVGLYIKKERQTKCLYIEIGDQTGFMWLLFGRGWKRKLILTITLLFFFLLGCLFLPISSGHHWSGGGKIHGSRSRSPARISQQPVLPVPPQHTPLQGQNHFFLHLMILLQTLDVFASNSSYIPRVVLYLWKLKQIIIILEQCSIK